MKFFAILRSWADQKAGGNATTPEFVALAEQVSGMQLDTLFDQWLFTPGRPALPTDTCRRRGDRPADDGISQLGGPLARRSAGPTRVRRPLTVAGGCVPRRDLMRTLVGAAVPAGQTPLSGAQGRLAPGR